MTGPVPITASPSTARETFGLGLTVPLNLVRLRAALLNLDAGQRRREAPAAARLRSPVESGGVVPVGPTEDNLRSAVEGETYEYTEMYPGFAKTARNEGFDSIGEWFETLAKAEKSHAGRFTQGLEKVS